VGRVALITRKAEISNKQGMIKRPERPKILRSEGEGRGLAKKVG